MSGLLSKDELVVVIYGAWHLWKERCRRVFQNSSMSERQLLEMLKDDLFLLGTYPQEKAGDDELGIA